MDAGRQTQGQWGPELSPYPILLALRHSPSVTGHSPFALWGSRTPARERMSIAWSFDPFPR